MYLKVFLVLLTFICCVIGDDPIVIISETDPKKNTVYNQVVSEKDRDVQFTCIVQNKPEGIDVKWEAKLGNSTISISTATAVKADAFRYSIDQPSPTAWRLRISNAQITDDGKYSCNVQVGSLIYEEAYEYLRVVERPQIADLLTSSDTIVKEGDQVDFKCDATGRPKPVIRWTRMAGELLPSGGEELRKKFLNIDEVKPDDAGIYICTADNEAGHDERKIELTVKHKPLVNAENERVSQALGYSKTLVCNIRAHPVADVSWSRDLYPLQSSERVNIYTIPGALNKLTSVLRIRSVRTDDFGQYTCSAVNSQGEGVDTMIFEESSVPTPDRDGIISGASILVFSSMTLLMVLLTCLLQ